MRSIVITIVLALLILLGQWLFLAPPEFEAGIKAVLIAAGAFAFVFIVVLLTQLDSTAHFRAVFAQNLPELKKDCVTAIYYVNRESKSDAAVIKSSFEVAGYNPRKINPTVPDQHEAVSIRSNDPELLKGVWRAFRCVGVGASMHVIKSPQILLEITVKDRIGYWF